MAAVEEAEVVAVVRPVDVVIGLPVAGLPACPVPFAVAVLVLPP